MDWVFEHLQVIIAIAGAIAYWLVQTRKQRELRREAQTELGRQPTPEEMAERARRLQEAIRRKIAQRTGAAPTAQDVEDELLFPTPPVAETARPATPPPLPVPPRLPPAQPEFSPGAEAVAAALAEQRSVAERYAWLPESSRAAPAAAPSPFSATSPIAVTAPVAAGPDWAALREEAGDPAALRRVFLWREILGPPRSLQ